MVTKEDVEKAKAIWVEANASWAAAWAAHEPVVDTAWNNYQKLKREYENGKG